MKKRNRGFTLLELMVVLVIAGVLIGVGVPAFRNFIMDARMTSTANDLIAALHYTRSEAIKRRAAVSMCATADALAANPVCTEATLPPAEGEDPEVPSVAGWVVFVDSNGDGRFANPSYFDLDGDGRQDAISEDANGNQQFDPGEDTDADGNFDLGEEVTLDAEIVIQRGQAVPSSIQARSTADPFTITFRDNGQIAGNAVDVVFCDDRGNRSSYGDLSTARAVSISVTGRPSVTRDKGEITAKGGCG